MNQSIPDAGRIRLRCKPAPNYLQQVEFAKALGISVKTLRNWEQRRRKPSGPALALLRLLELDITLLDRLASPHETGRDS